MSITAVDLVFTYNPNTPFEKPAIKGVSVQIEKGEFVGIIGHTGSGKSTFIQHLNGLIPVQEGFLEVQDFELSAKPKKRKDKKAYKQSLRKLRGDVGMVFQYPEYQLFEDTVAKDVAYGPKNIGVPKEEIEERVKNAVELCGLNYDDIKDRSPFDLSGGQKRRVAIAGIIAMNPKVLILDEPTAGLDPGGKEQLLALIKKLKTESIETIIVISHDMDEITRLAERMIVFNKGKILYDLPPAELFKNQEEIINVGLDVPTAVKVKNMLAKRGIVLPDDTVTIERFCSEIADLYTSVTTSGELVKDKEGNSK